MDSTLAQRLTNLARQITRLEKVERESLIIDSQEKTIFSELFLKQQTGSIAEKEARVYASKEWIEFARGQVAAKVEYNKAKRLYELQDKAYLAEHLTYKVESAAIGRGVE